MLKIRTFQKKVKVVINLLAFIKQAKLRKKNKDNQFLSRYGLENQINNQQHESQQQQEEQQQQLNEPNENIIIDRKSISQKEGKIINVYSSNSYMFFKYNQLKKIVSTIFEGLDLDYLENAQHFFNSNLVAYSLLKILQEGDGFGELGLLNNQPRAATIVALSDCYIGYLPAKNYQQTLFQIDQEKLMKKNNIIKPMIIENVDRISNEKMSKISQFFTKVKFYIGNTIQKQEDKISCIYLIYKGEVELFRDNQASENNKDNYKMTNKQNNEQPEDQKLINSTVLNRQNPKQTWLQKQKETKIGIIGCQQFIGEESLFSNKLSQYTAIVKSEKVSAFQISKTNIIRLIMEFPLIENFMKKKLLIKQSWYQQRIVEDQQLQQSLSEKLLNMHRKRKNHVTLRVSEKDYKPTPNEQFHCQVIGNQQQLAQSKSQMNIYTQEQPQQQQSQIQEQQHQQIQINFSMNVCSQDAIQKKSVQQQIDINQNCKTSPIQGRHRKKKSFPKFNPLLIDIVKQNQKILKKKGKKIDIQDLYKYTRAVCNMKVETPRYQSNAILHTQPNNTAKTEQQAITLHTTIQEDSSKKCLTNQHYLSNLNFDQGSQTNQIYRIMEKHSLQSIRPTSAFKIKQSIIHIKSDQVQNQQLTESKISHQKSLQSSPPPLEKDKIVSIYQSPNTQQQLDVKDYLSIMQSRTNTTSGDIISFHQLSNSRFSKTSELKNRKYVKSNIFMHDSRNDSRSQQQSQVTLEDIQGISLQNTPIGSRQMQQKKLIEILDKVSKPNDYAQTTKHFCFNNIKSTSNFYLENQNLITQQKKIIVLDHMRRPIRFVSQNNLTKNPKLQQTYTVQ